MSFIDLVSQKKIVVCLGAGGVGKTTVSAALGFLGAHLGKKTLIVTIDPAKRLADAIGVHIGSKPQRIAIDSLIKNEFRPKASIDAMMLDLPAAWADLITRLSPSHQVGSAIFSNRFYRYLSQEMAGSQEFVACEALYTLAHEHHYDLIVLDTPPTAHALDFLDAPDRILSFLDQEAFHFFLQQKHKKVSKFGLRFLGGAGHFAGDILGKFVSLAFLEELSDFLLVFSELYSPIIQRTRDFQHLLKGDDTGFAVVLTPKSNAIKEATQIYTELTQRHLPFLGFIANRISALPKLKPVTKAENDKLVQMIVATHANQDQAIQLIHCMLAAVKDEEKMAAHEALLLKEFQKQVHHKTIVKLPRLPVEVGSVPALLELLAGLMYKN